MPASTAKIGTLRLTGGFPAGRRALSVPVPRALAPTARTIPERAAVGATDARWALAVRVAQRLQGGAAAILAPEDRGALLGQATRLGLRPFDASLIIAIVQDGARSGLDPLGVATEDGLSMIRPAERGARDSVLGPLVCSVLLAAGMMAAMIVWVVGGH